MQGGCKTQLKLRLHSRCTEDLRLEGTLGITEPIPTGLGPAKPKECQQPLGKLLEGSISLTVGKKRVLLLSLHFSLCTLWGRWKENLFYKIRTIDTETREIENWTITELQNSFPHFLKLLASYRLEIIQSISRFILKDSVIWSKEMWFLLPKILLVLYIFTES